MLVHEVMTKEPVTVRTGTPVKEALTLLANHRVTSLPVVNAAGKICGVVSEADLVRELLARDPRAHEIPPTDEDRGRFRAVDDVMSPHPVTVPPEEDLVKAVDLLTSTTVKSLPVVDRKGHLLGVLSRSDVVRLLARADEDIRGEVDELLRSTGIEGWLVDVRDGSVELLGPEHSTDGLLVRLLAESVPGVIDVVARQERHA